MIIYKYTYYPMKNVLDLLSFWDASGIVSLQKFRVLTLISVVLISYQSSPCKVLLLLLQSKAQISKFPLVDF